MKTLPTLLLISLFLFLSAASTELWAQREGISMRDLYTKVGSVVDEADKEDLEIVRIELDLNFNKKSSYRVLTDNWEYGIMAFGDYRINKVKIRTYYYDETQKSWILASESEEKTTPSSSGAGSGSSSSTTTSSNEGGGVAYTAVKPSKTQEYRIDVEVTEFAEGYNGGHYAVVIFHK